MLEEVELAFGEGLGETTVGVAGQRTGFDMRVLPEFDDELVALMNRPGLDFAIKFGRKFDQLGATDTAGFDGFFKKLRGPRSVLGVGEFVKLPEGLAEEGR